MIRCCTFSAQETWRRLSTVVLVHNSQSPNRGAGLRAFAQLNTMSLCAAPRLYRRAHRALRIWAHKMSLQTSGAPAGDCECPCDGTEGWPWRWTQSHSSAIRGVAPIQAQIPTEIQRPSCCGRQTYTRPDTNAPLLLLEKKVVLCTSLRMHRDTSGLSVCLKERNGQDYHAVVPAQVLITYHTFRLNTRC